ncbi:uncharacterized protein cubi_02788 [Cryptosporidium ubiquitum]|uniref:FPL domain-containing protein n=1 Tax=Cryptosporidium ubiquitum TaxID=857276 RepID=A0A1J4MIA7_9CRYT|nr:uncharacterized protein cubi_02788 [Cryptosporidium ubiquitum]OII73986.1 hypothetical protein cubi_02788 [Cryptosporidium ubiquitum]
MNYFSGKFCNLEDYKQLCGDILSYYSSLNKPRKLEKNQREHSILNISFDPKNFQLINSSKIFSEKEIVENIRTVAEVLIWEDQNEEQGYFEITCEFEIFSILVELVINIEVNYSIRKQSLQTLSIILQNIRNINILYYILSNNVITKLLNNTFRSGSLHNTSQNSYEIDLNISIISKEEEEEDELLSYYIALLRTLALRLNKETIRLFINNSTEFPLWKNACMYINHRDTMVRNTSRNVLLNILRIREKEIIDYIVLEEIKHFNYLGQIEEVIRNIEIDPNITQDLFRESFYSHENHSISIIQILISSLIKQIHQFGELAEKVDFGWPEIEEYMCLIINDQQESHPYDDETNEITQTVNMSPISATSPITLSYTETDSTNEYNSPIVNQLNPTFYDRLIKPLGKQVEIILDLMELFHEFVFLEIQSISWLFCNSILHQVFEMVLFQKITNEISYINQGISRNTLSIKIYLYITYQLILFLYNNNQNKVYDLLISNIWERFLKLGNQQTLFGNIFSTLINYLEQDSEFVLMFGLLSLYSIWGKKYEEKIKDAIIEDPPENSLSCNETTLSERKEKKKMEISTKKDLETSNIVPNLFQSFINNFSNFFHQKDDQESLIEEIYRTKNTENISLVEIEFTNPICSNLSLKQKQIHQRSFEKRRCKSLPRNWKCGQEDKNNFLYSLESSNTMMKACIKEKILKKDFESIISQSELLIKKEFQSFYSKLNFEILSHELNNQGLECLLFLAQFLEKIVSISKKNNYMTKLRPLCLFIVTFLTLGVIQDHETVRQSNYFQDFCSLLDTFMGYFKNITLRHIGDLLRRDLNTGEKYSIFNEIGNLNYMICENFLEWKDEDELLILRMFENYNNTILWTQKVISNFCILPLIRDSSSRKLSKRYLWNLIDTYPIFRWFPNNSCNLFVNEEGSGNSRSIFIDKLRSNYNNLQIFEIFCGLLKRFRRDKNSNNDLKDLNKDTEKKVNETELERSYGIDNNNCFRVLYKKMRILVETKSYRVSVIRAKKVNRPSNYGKNIQCNVIFDLSRKNLVLTSLLMKPEKKSIMLANLKIIRCKPVPIITRSYKTAIRYLVALLLRYRRHELEEDVILDDLLYELPLREDLLSSPNIFKGAIIQPRERKVNRRIYHLNNLLLPVYTRVLVDNRRGGFGEDLNFSDYALYMEFESKKKSQEFIKNLNELRRDEHVERLFEEYSSMFK